MKVYNSPSEFSKTGYNVVTNGTFDGVHKGHQKILARLKELASANSGETVLITFWPHPRHVLYPDQPLSMINTLDEKIELLEKAGIDHLIKIPFTKEFSQLSSDQFIQNILIDTIGTDMLVIGYNHRFGKNREGSFDYLSQNQDKFGFEVVEISRQEIDDVSISSTNIRKALADAEIATANEFLGYPFSLRGTVVSGDGIGRTIGYPTANIHLDEPYKLIPPDGVYAIIADVEGTRRNGMLYVGWRPTVNGDKRVIEVNLFDFDGDIYNLKINVQIFDHVRGDMKFKGLEDLKTQIDKDKLATREILDRYE